jgi:hypothetical protein
MSLLFSYRCEAIKKQCVSGSIPLPLVSAELYKPLRPCHDSGSCHWSLTVESLGNFQASACGIVVDKVALGQVFCRLRRFFQSVLGPG